MLKHSLKELSLSWLWAMFKHIFVFFKWAITPHLPDSCWLKPFCAVSRVFPNFKGCGHIACRQCWRLTYCHFYDVFICRGNFWEYRELLMRSKGVSWIAAFVTWIDCIKRNHSKKNPVHKCTEVHFPYRWLEYKYAEYFTRFFGWSE